MMDQLNSNSLIQRFPASSWIRFLRTYGPTPSNSTMFDEHVTKAARLAKVEPIKLPTPILDEILGCLKEQGRGSVIIAGTAGDGKTYHCRAIWESLGGNPADWNKSEAAIKKLDLVDGRTVYFVKDLSELGDEDGASILEKLEDSTLRGNNQDVLVIAANHGQILERLRKRKFEDQLVHPLRPKLEEVFLQTGKGHSRLNVFDLSKSANRKSLTTVLDVLVQHTEWEKCQSCYFQTEANYCPIYENRRRLLGDSKESLLIRERLDDLIELARLNGAHLPVRDLLALCANILLGHSEVKDGLMRCNDVEGISSEKTFFKGSLFNNIMGANLPNARVSERPAFKALKSFQIGSETTSLIDNLLIYGKYEPTMASDYRELIQLDRMYGGTEYFDSVQDAYLEGDEQSKEVNNSRFLDLLKGQRRRLFFTLPTIHFGLGYFWQLSALKNAGLYLSMFQDLQNNKLVSEQTRQLIVRGLNRILTGMLIDDTENIFIATSGGFTQSKVSVLCKDEIPARPGRRGREGMTVKLDHNKKPVLEFRLLNEDLYNVNFELTPTRFEFLTRVADGALPNSFSSECLEDLLALKARLLRQAEQIQNEDSDSESEDTLQLRLVADSASTGSKTIFVRLAK